MRLRDADQVKQHLQVYNPNLNPNPNHNPNPNPDPNPSLHAESYWR